MHFKRASKEDFEKNLPLREFFVWWNEINVEDVEKFESHLEMATKERNLQEYLESNPIVLIQYLGGGHGRWVIPQKRLGSDYVTDFVIGERDSMGFHWTAVELEGPKDKMFNKNGDVSAKLNHAIRQITDWRAWLKNNQNYTSRNRKADGLGLRDIDPDLNGLILIGRSDTIDPATNERRRQLSKQQKINIHSYDWLTRNARGRVEALSRRSY